MGSLSAKLASLASDDSWPGRRKEGGSPRPPIRRSDLQRRRLRHHERRIVLPVHAGNVDVELDLVTVRIAQTAAAIGTAARVPSPSLSVYYTKYASCRERRAEREGRVPSSWHFAKLDLE
jgi:hypothetical protein